MTPFYRFTIRFLTAVFSGMLLLLCRGAMRSGPLAALAPQFRSPWELGKLAFWPLLLCSAVWGEGRLLPQDHALAALSTLALVLLDWAVLALGGDGRLCLVLWVSLLAAGLGCLPEAGGSPRLWRTCTAALAVGYVLFTFSPPSWGPFRAF